MSEEIKTPEMIGVEQVAVLLAQARDEGRREVVQSAQAIAELCMLAGCPDRAAEFIGAAKTEVHVRRVLIDARAAHSEASEIRSTISVDAGTQDINRPGASPIVAAVKKLNTP